MDESIIFYLKGEKKLRGQFAVYERENYFILLTSREISVQQYTEQEMLLQVFKENTEEMDIFSLERTSSTLVERSCLSRVCLVSFLAAV